MAAGAFVSRLRVITFYCPAIGLRWTRCACLAQRRVARSGDAAAFLFKRLVETPRSCWRQLLRATLTLSKVQVVRVARLGLTWSCRPKVEPKRLQWQL